MAESTNHRKQKDEVLLVGLSPQEIRPLKSELLEHHYLVLEENDVKEALKKIHEDEVSAVILDQKTVSSESLEFVKKCSKRMSHPSVIVLTESRSMKNMRELFQEGVHDCLLKPFQVSHLLHALKRGLERRKAKIYGIKDPLTSLYNRYAFREMLHAEIDRAKRYDRHLSLLMIDIDYFKKVNDKFGHIIGDQILIQLSEILKSSFRKTDIVARFGGEEFAIILPETTTGHATLLAERIRKKIEHFDYSKLIGHEPLTVSIGVSNYHTPGQKNDMTLIHSADQALYAAKQKGRNKVVISVPSKPREDLTRA